MLKSLGISYAKQIDYTKDVRHYNGKPFNNAITKVDLEITDEGKCMLSYNVFNINYLVDDYSVQDLNGASYYRPDCLVEYDSMNKFEMESFNILMSKENNIKLQRIKNISCESHI